MTPAGWAWSGIAIQLVGWGMAGFHEKNVGLGLWNVSFDGNAQTVYVIGCVFWAVGVVLGLAGLVRGLFTDG